MTCQCPWDRILSQNERKAKLTIYVCTNNKILFIYNYYTKILTIIGAINIYITGRRMFGAAGWRRKSAFYFINTHNSWLQTAQKLQHNNNLATAHDSFTLIWYFLEYSCRIRLVQEFSIWRTFQKSKRYIISLIFDKDFPLHTISTEFINHMGAESLSNLSILITRGHSKVKVGIYEEPTQ